MFTGIVEEIGTVTRRVRRPGGLELEIAAEAVLAGTGIGDSIAINGVCLTVVAISDGGVSVEVVPETLRRTNLDELTESDPVNLERAIAAGRTFGGHYVQGHVDGTAVIALIEPDGDAQNYRFELDSSLMRYVVPQGFVALDGASLTVVDVGGTSFEVTLVPHTQTAVVMSRKAPGYRVNVEVDVMAKYVERIAGARLASIETRLAALEK